MKEYHKINTIYKRDQQGKILIGQYSTPELEYLANNEWYFTEKIDGTNIRVMWDGTTVRFGGKTENAQIPAFLVTKLLELFPKEKFESIWHESPIQICLYGEGYGAKIQKGGGNYISNGVSFILFDVWIDGWWLKRDDINGIAINMDIGYVPTIGTGILKDAVFMVEQGFNSIFGVFNAEGIVARPKYELFCRNGERIITKIKHKDFK